MLNPFNSFLFGIKIWWYILRNKSFNILNIHWFIKLTWLSIWTVGISCLVPVEWDRRNWGYIRVWLILIISILISILSLWIARHLFGLHLWKVSIWLLVINILIWYGVSLTKIVRKHMCKVPYWKVEKIFKLKL